MSEAARAVVLEPGPHRWASGLARLLVGADPVQAGALWDRLAAATPFSGPSGIARHALAAVDIAVHDLAGRQLGRPAYHLLGGARRDAPLPVRDRLRRRGRRAQPRGADGRHDDAHGARPRARLPRREDGGAVRRPGQRPRARGLHPRGAARRRRRRRAARRLRLPLARLARRALGAAAPRGRAPVSSPRRRCRTTTSRATRGSRRGSRRGSAARSSPRRGRSAAPGWTSGTSTCCSPTWPGPAA